MRRQCRLRVPTSSSALAQDPDQRLPGGGSYPAGRPRRARPALIVLHLIFILAIGLLFKGKANDPSNDFRRGGKRRYGPVNEQFFTWAQAPLGVIQAGIWLNGLAIFTSAVFGISIETTIVITGLVVMFVSFSGGARAVVASDDVRMLVIVAISITATVFVAIEFGIDLAAQYPTLGSAASVASYLAFVDLAMPVGMVGIMMAALFSATMSSMDSGLNRSAGIMCPNFYQPFIKRGTAGDAELMIVGTLITLLFGIVIVPVGPFIASLENISLFDIMLQMGSLIQMPILIPMFLAIFVRRVPDGARWAT